jgi:hypothetical protein
MVCRHPHLPASATNHHCCPPAAPNHTTPPPPAGLFAKATADGNAAALDKALEALQAFLAKASDDRAARIASSVCSNLVSKTLGARPGTAAKGLDCLAGFVELEQADKAAVSGRRCGGGCAGGMSCI